MLLHTFHPQPIALALGGLEIRWYGIFLSLGALAGYFLMRRLGRRAGFHDHDLIDLFLWLVVTGFIGGRLYHVLNEIGYYSAHPSEIVMVWNGGLGIHGGIVAGLVTLIIFARRKKMDVWKLLDVLAPAFALGQAIGRWGNYFNQELFGGPTSLPWGIPIDPLHRPLQYMSDRFFHPTFLYESLGSLVIVAILLLMWKKRPRLSGTIALVYFMLYGVLRIATESLRIDQTPIIAGVRLPIIVSTLIILGSIACFIYLRVRATKMKNSQDLLPARTFTPEEKKQWLASIIDIYDRVREKAKNGPYDVTFGKLSLTVLPNVYPPTAFTDTLWFAQQVRTIVNKNSLLEIGTGSGAIALYCALHGAKVVATDVNPEAVKNTTLNAERHHLNVSVREGNLFEPLGDDEKFDYIFWAHPFNNWDVPVEDMLLRSGLDYHYEALRGYIAGAKKHLNPHGKLLLGTGDSADLHTIKTVAKENGYSLKLLKEITMPLEEGSDKKITDLLYELSPLQS